MYGSVGNIVKPEKNFWEIQLSGIVYYATTLYIVR